MKYIKQKVLEERTIGNSQIIIKGDGSIEINPTDNANTLTISGNLKVTGSAAGPTNSLVYYVSEEGNDTNDGLAAGPDRSKRSVKSAVEAAPAGATIQLAPGNFYENNPITLKERQTVRGDSLRNTLIWPNNNQNDMFFVDNACYIFQVTVRGLRDPAWFVRIKPGALVTVSPYVQNCTNMNGPWLNDGTEFIPFETQQIIGVEATARPIINDEAVPLGKRINENGGGNGMLVDGAAYNQRSLVFSMVADAFTQIAQGGIGFHVTNFGYTQIVSCFTVFCRTGFMTTNGGYLSISNSVSDFGTFGIVADGLFNIPYTSAVPSQDYFSTVGSITVNNSGVGYSTAPVVTIDPPTGDTGGIQATGTATIDINTGRVTSVSIDEPGTGYAEVPVITFTGGGASIIATATAALATNILIEVTSLRDLPQVGSVIGFEGDATKYYITDTNILQQPFFYNEITCRRDTRLIIDAVISDAVLGTNYQAIAAARSYLRAVATKVITQQLSATVFALEFARDEVLDRVPDSDPANDTIRYAIIEGFANVITTIQQGDESLIPVIDYNELSAIDSGIIAAKTNIIQNRNFIVEEVNRYIAEQFTNLSYNQTNSENDVRLLTSASAFDVGTGSNFNSITVARSYLRASAAIVQSSQLIITIASFTYVKSLMLALSEVSGNANAETRVNNSIDEIIEILQQGDSTSADDLQFPTPVGGIIAKTNAKDQLRANREFIQEEIIAWIENSYPSLIYNQSDYSRDVGYIIDALSYDLLYGGNSASRTSAQSYFFGAINQLSDAEVIAISEAYTRLQEILVDIIQSRAIVKTIGNTLNQDFTNDPGTVNETNISTTLIQLVIDVIEAGNINNIPQNQNPDISWQDQLIQDASSQIFGQRGIFPGLATTFILENYPTLTYDRNKFRQDVELIVDAIARDIRLGTNHNTIVAGLAYQRATVNISESGQFPATIIALRYLQTVVESSVSLSLTAVSRATNRFETLLEIVEYGTIPSEGMTFPAPGSASQTTIDAARQLQDNRSFLIEETIAYTNFTYPSLIYNEDKCRRDTGYIIDGVTHDLLYQGNRSTLISARSYYDGAVSVLPASQEFETVGSLERLKIVTEQVILGIMVTKTTGNAESQIMTGGYGTSIDSTTTDTLFDIVINAITSGLTSTPNNVDPAYSWVSSEIINVTEVLLDGTQGIQDLVIDYITNEIIGFSYNIETCARDTGYVVDAAVYDMMYGGNKQTRRAAEAYYNNVVNPGETAETEFAYKHLASVLSNVAQNIAVSPSDGNVIAQEVAGTVGSSNAGQLIFTNVEKISQVIREGSSSLPFEIDHDYVGLGNNDDIIDRQTILNDIQLIEDATISALNLQYGGVAELVLFPGITSVSAGTLGVMQNVSTVSTSGHAFEYVGAGTTYNALPFFGGSPISENEFVESNNGKVFAGGVVDQIGNFKVGNFFTVNALTGAITLNANEINLSGLSAIGPFRRNGIPVGVVLREVSNSTDLRASTGVAESDTAPTQSAVVSYVENRYLNKTTGGTVAGNLNVDGIITGDGSAITTLNASNLASGTVPNARVTGTYSNLTGTGALNSGSITTGFGNIDIGTNTFTGALLSVSGILEISSQSTTLATVTQTLIASFVAATYSSGKFAIQAKNTVTGEVQLSELLVVHDGTTATATEYGIIHTGTNPLATFDVDISSGNVRILATGANANNTVYKITENLITA